MKQDFEFRILSTGAQTHLFLNGVRIGGVRNWHFKLKPNPKKPTSSPSVEDLKKGHNYSGIVAAHQFLGSLIDTINLPPENLIQVKCSKCGEPAGLQPKQNKTPKNILCIHCQPSK